MCGVVVVLFLWVFVCVLGGYYYFVVVLKGDEICKWFVIFYICCMLFEYVLLVVYVMIGVDDLMVISLDDLVV